MGHGNESVRSRISNDNPRTDCSRKRYMSLRGEAGDSRSEAISEHGAADASATSEQDIAAAKYQVESSDDSTDDESEPQVDKDVADLVLQILGEDTRAHTDRVRAFVKATKEPPITKASLSELDIGSIINNSKLRHDINFDRDLSFRPNSDGFRGSQKKRESSRYWLAIEIELSLVFTILSSSQFKQESKPELIKQCYCRLPHLFDTIKEVVVALVPQSDHQGVEEHFDSTMLLQQIQRGVCNFSSVATWISLLLKKHCAPMRDEMVERMLSHISAGTEESIASGLRELFSVLESMKLDIANHQIRYLRQLLIEDTISFEKRYHESRMLRGRYDVVAAYKWFQDLRKEALDAGRVVAPHPSADIQSFVRGLIQHLMPTDKSLPDTFTLDRDRVRNIRNDIEDLVREEICCDILGELAVAGGSKLRPQQRTKFCESFRSIIKDCKFAGWRVYADATVCEIVRHVLLARGSTAVTNARLEARVQTMLRLRWRALECARNGFILGLDDPLHPCEPEMQRTQRYTSHLEKEFFTPIFKIVEQSISKSPCDIVKDLVPESPSSKPGCASPSPPLPPPPKPMDSKQELIRKIAHIAILHWRIWEPLVYNNEDLARQVKAEQQVMMSIPRRPAHRTNLGARKECSVSPTDSSPYLPSVDKPGKGEAVH